MRSKFWHLACGMGLVALLAAARPGLAQETDPYRLARLRAPVHLDGPSYEAAWEDVAPFPFTVYEPVAGQPPSERTEVRVAYDDAYLYVALRAYDSDPGGIRANSLYRDRLSGDDFFTILFDTFNDNETAVTFTATPAGMRRDAAVSNDGSGPGSLNSEFNTFWDLATAVTDEGWFAEMRIPFSSLRFQERDGRVVMGLIVHRFIARKSERVSFPPLPAHTGRAYTKPSLARKVMLEGVHGHRPLYVAPYVLQGMGRTMARGADAVYRPDRSHQEELGLDLKYSLARNLTLDVTLNTDFAQAEADDQQVNLTRFSLFYPEKRPFFQERSGMFEFRTGRQSRLFHSRRIGLTEGGEPVRILGGARLVGRWGGWDLGLLNMQTAALEGLPGENFGVLRLRRRVLNEHSYAGGMATTRLGLDGGYNVAYGLDGVFRVQGDDYLSLQWAQTLDRARWGAGVMRPLSSGTLSMLFERRRRQGVGFVSRLTWAGPHYDPGVGFVQRQDFTQGDQTLSYTWLPGTSSALIWHAVELLGVVSLRNDDRQVETVEVGPSWRLALKSGGEASVSTQLVYESLRDGFSLSPEALVPEGIYRFYRGAASYRMTTARLLRSDLEVVGGGFYDGYGVTASLQPAWNVSRHLEVGGEYVYNDYRFPARDQHFRAHILRLRIGTALNTKLSTNAFVQYNSAREAVSANVRFRYNLREGSDLWIVYNEGLNTDGLRPTSLLPLSETRMLLVKYAHTFRL